MGVLEAVHYALSELRDNYRRPYWWKQRLIHRVLSPIHATYPGYDDAVPVMEADWDTLIVLDACRADLFEARADMDRYDEYRREVSLGSSTPEWTRRNFAGREFGDTVYVSGNPQISKFAADAFHDVIPVWETDFDDERRTVRPEAVRDATIDAHEDYPNKRLIAHFMQPHQPILDREERFSETAVSEKLLHEADSELATLQRHVGREAVWDALGYNLDRALESVVDLQESLEGRTVVTADHGELLGEWGWPLPIKLYGHPSGVRSAGVVEVPWAVHDSGGRRRIVDEGVTETTPGDAVEERLSMLGYG